VTGGKIGVWFPVLGGLFLSTIIVPRPILGVTLITWNRMERRSRERSSSAGSEKMESVGDRQGKMERYCSTGQSPQRAVAPTEEGEDDRCWVRPFYYARLQNCKKATISFVMSVCLSVWSSVRMEQLGSHWTNFHEIWYLMFEYFSKIYRENSISTEIWQV